MYDVFISYRRAGGTYMAMLLYYQLKSRGLDVFLDRNDLQYGEDFDKKIKGAIRNSKNFIPVLFPGIFDRKTEKKAEKDTEEIDWYVEEIKYALKQKKVIRIIPVIFNHSSDTNSFETAILESIPQSISSLSLKHAVMVNNQKFEDSIEDIYNSLQDIITVSTDRKKNQYLSQMKDSEKQEEEIRLTIQQNLMKSFDQVLYHKAIEEFDELYILDLGSHNGSLVMDRIGSHPKVKKLLGVDCDGETVAAANDKYGEENKICFFQADIEDENFSKQLLSEMKRMQINAFNVVNLSMILLHLKDPRKLLGNLREVIKPGGLLLIKDVDDGMNLVYPDVGGDFARVIEICAKNKTSGCRCSGRQIPTQLERSGYKEIILEKAGIHTLQMGYEEKDELFKTYFSFILKDLETMAKDPKASNEIIEDLKWYHEKYDELRGRIQDKSLFFQLGMILISAKR